VNVDVGELVEVGGLRAVGAVVIGDRDAPRGRGARDAGHVAVVAVDVDLRHLVALRRVARRAVARDLERDGAEPVIGGRFGLGLQVRVVGDDHIEVVGGAGQFGDVRGGLDADGGGPAVADRVAGHAGARRGFRGGRVAGEREADVDAVAHRPVAHVHEVVVLDADVLAVDDRDPVEVKPADLAVTDGDALGVVDQDRAASLSRQTRGLALADERDADDVEVGDGGLRGAVVDAALHAARGRGDRRAVALDANVALGEQFVDEVVVADAKMHDAPAGGRGSVDERLEVRRVRGCDTRRGGGDDDAAIRRRARWPGGRNGRHPAHAPK
jgi:hypothetical protein